MRLFPLLYLVCILGYSQQDTIKLDGVHLYGQSNSNILKNIQKNFKKNFFEKEKLYTLVLQTTCNDEDIFSISETISFGKKNVEKRTFPENIETKLKTDYFSSKNIDEFDSPVFLITKASLRYIKLDDYIMDIKVQKVEQSEGNFLDIFGTYNAQNIDIRVEVPSLNIVSLKIATYAPIYDKSTSITKGTSKYTNSTSSYYLEQKITIDYLTENGKTHLKYFENNMQVDDYIVQLFDRNKRNNLLKEYVFKIKSFLKISQLNPN